MTTRAGDNEAFVLAVQKWLGVKEDGHAGLITMAAFLEKIGNGWKKPDHLVPSQAAIDLMHRFEGCRLTAYKDPGSKDGKPHTIGWGSTGPDIKLGMVWTQQQADDRFKADLAKFAGQVRAALGNAPTTQSQFDAMVSLAYNIGIGAFTGSTLLKKHKAGDYAGAKAAFLSWRFNDGKEMAGLVNRRTAEAKLYGGG